MTITQGNAPMPFRSIAKELLVLIAIGVFTAFTVNSLSPRGIAFFGDWDTTLGVITARPKNDVVAHELEIQSTRMAKEIFDSGKAVFVDGRARKIYEDGHIKGAVLLPIDQFEELIDDFLKKYPESGMIVTYCFGRECDDSHELAQILIDEGYTNVRVFVDGYPGWVEEGYPIE